MLRAAGLSTASGKDFLDLMKPRVMSLVIFTALTGLMAAPGTLHPIIAATALLCIAIGAGASGALNMWYDADIDAVMGRTALRPIPSGAVTARQAFGFGLLLSVFSVLMLGVLVNWAAAGLLAFTIFFYVAIYTMWLKRWTSQNIVIGGLAGAFPPAIGWLAVTGTLTFEPILMVLIIFMWTPPHFWALAILKEEDYGRAGVPMLPNVAGDSETRRQIVLYSVLLAPLAVLPAFLGYTGILYGLVSLFLGVAFVHRAFVLKAADGLEQRNREAGRLFGFSILYLFAVFAVMLGEDVVERLFDVNLAMPAALTFTFGA
ncbi:MAG: heme o synthase [Pseudomonadota bacterium]